MTDLADYGNASAGASPHNGVIVYVAPPSRTLETMPSSERMYSLMNHETVHVANADVANSRDQRWRAVLRRQAALRTRNTRSRSSTTTSRCRVTTRHAGTSKVRATFMETWMAGASAGPRARSTKWCSARWSATTRISAATSAWYPRALPRISRLSPMPICTEPGSTPTSHTVHSPEAVVEWLKRGEGSEAYYVAPVRPGIRRAARNRVGRVDRVGA